MHWRRTWQRTPVFLPGGSQGGGSLVGCRLWGRTESDTTEATQQQQQVLLSKASVCGAVAFTRLVRVENGLAVEEDRWAGPGTAGRTPALGSAVVLLGMYLLRGAGNVCAHNYMHVGVGGCCSMGDCPNLEAPLQEVDG